MSIGTEIRTLLSKGKLVGDYDADKISEINRELRFLNYQAVQNNTRTLLVLKDFEPKPFKNTKILINLRNHIQNGDKLENNTLNWLNEMEWYADGDFTDIFLIQNEEHLLENFGDIFFRCELCNLLVKGKNVHEYCQNLYNQRVKMNMFPGMKHEKHL